MPWALDVIDLYGSSHERLAGQLVTILRPGALSAASEAMESWPASRAATSRNAWPVGESGSPRQDRRALVAPLANRGDHGDLSEKRDSETIRGPLSSAPGEDLVLLAAAVAHEVAHVLDHPDDGNVDLVEHGLGPHHVGQGHVLRRRHQHRAAALELLRKGDLHVSGARRHVHHQVVQLAPLHVGHELLQGLAEQWGRARSPPGPAPGRTRWTSREARGPWAARA